MLKGLSLKPFNIHVKLYGRVDKQIALHTSLLPDDDLVYIDHLYMRQ